MTRASVPSRARAASMSASVGPVRIAIRLNSEYLLEDLANRRERIELPALHLTEQAGELGIVGDGLLEVRLGPRARDCEDLAREVVRTPFREQPVLLQMPRCSAIFAQSSSMPSPLTASVRTIGGCQPSSSPSARIERTSFTIVFAAGWSRLLTAMTSGISMIPALSAWIESPDPGISTSRTVSAI